METLRKLSSCLYVFNIWMQNDLDPRRGAMILYQPFGLEVRKCFLTPKGSYDYRIGNDLLRTPKGCHDCHAIPLSVVNLSIY